MDIKDIIKTYFSKNMKFFERISEFEKRRGLNLFQKLKNDENEINAYSWLAEIEFGLCFDKFSEKLSFDSFIEKGIKPDWVITNNSQRIICEVLRINTDQQDFQEYLDWQKHVAVYNQQHPATPIVGRSDSFTGSCEYFYGHQRKIEKKEDKYGTFVSRHKLPFVLCIQSTEQTLIGQHDAADFFHTQSFGIFKTHEGIRKNVTGVLFRDFFGQFCFYANDFCENKLNGLNQQFFDNIQNILA